MGVEFGLLGDLVLASASTTSSGVSSSPGFVQVSVFILCARENVSLIDLAMGVGARQLYR
jgi:hypothetical protein